MIAVLSAMFDMDLVRHVLLVLPLSLIPNWQKEFEKWAPGIKTKCFHGSPRERTTVRMNYLSLQADEYDIELEDMNCDLASLGNSFE